MPGLDCASATKSTGYYQRTASPSSIPPRVAYPVEPFGFELLPRELPPPLLKGNRDGFWQQPGFFEQVNDRPSDEFACIHKVVFAQSLRGIHRARSGLRRPPEEGAKPCISISTRLQLLA